MRPEIPKLHAVLVAADEFSDPKLNRLKYPKREVELIRHVLADPESSIAGSVTTLTGLHATRYAVIKALDAAKTRAHGSQDVILLYWAGYSKYDPKSDDLMLITADSRSEMAIEGNLSVERDIAPISSDSKALLLVADGCNVGDALAGKLSRKYSRFASLSSSKVDQLVMERADASFPRSFASALRGEADDLDNDGLISAEEAFIYIYPRVVRASSGSWPQNPTIAGGSIHRMSLAKRREPSEKIYVDENLAEALFSPGEKVVKVNGQDPPVRISYEQKTIFLSDKETDIFQRGLNEIRLATRKVLAYLVDDKLKLLQEPYRRSRAIIVAINDYDRKHDKLHRGATGLRPLEQMVSDAEQLAKVLTGLGFEEILLLRNEEAESGRIEDLLKEFWKGGKYEDTDRLFFYFGGHGVTFERSGFLATYDYDESKPPLTAVALDDLVNRHAKNISSRHMLFAIDACYSGLALASTLEDSGERRPAVNSENIVSIILSDAKDRGRNLLLAGTGDEKAVYQSGGVFTRALVRGLKGDADTDRNGVIQFPELGNFIRNAVTHEARLHGYTQSPNEQILNRFGTGRVVFFLPPPKTMDN
ncbi:MAG: caspase family protein [Nitrososphaera sp.]|nr:caspase family protein [Nitrososphaera sp.]